MSRHVSLEEVDESLRSLQPVSDVSSQAEEVATVAAAAMVVQTAGNTPLTPPKSQPNYFAEYLLPPPDKNEDAKDDAVEVVRKCSRCRVKRVNETPEMLQKYQTCISCRMKRRVKKRKVRITPRLANQCENWQQYQQKVANNTRIDLFDHNYCSYTDEKLFPRYRPEELTFEIVEQVGHKVLERYLNPLQAVTGFRFAVRDHHRPMLTDLNHAQKITWMFVCSQDRMRQRPSRSKNKRQFSNRLKTEDCASKITLKYDLVSGLVELCYNHRHHYPYEWQRAAKTPVLGPSQEDSLVKADDVLDQLIQSDASDHTLDASQIVELATRATQDI